MRVRTSRWLRGAGALGLTVIACMTSAGVAAAGTQFRPGAPGIGDPYFPRDGNGGYDVKHYFLDLQYNPRTDVLRGQATIRARATQNLSRFNLDFVGLTVDGIRVNGCAASWTRNGHELVVTPCHGLPTRNEFIVVVRYHGVPQPIVDDQLGISGFIATNDGAVIAGQPHGAATWFPANDHPLDKASYTFRVKVPAGLEVVANGGLRNKWTRNGWTTWRWDAGKPMASYLATATMGQFNLRAYERGGIRFWDAIDPALFAVPEPRTGEQYAISQKGEPSYKRLARTIAVPAGGASLSFWINRDTEPEWDFVFVEARTVGQNDWTTLRDLNGHTSQNTGASCPYWHGLHPFLRHYQTDNGDDTCSPRGSTGRWWAASGASDGWERWRVDLSAYAGSTVRVSISYASDDLVQLPGAFVDDIVVSNGPGTTSFEDDGNTMDGWQVPGAPAGSAPNPNDWIVGTESDAPAPIGEDIEASFGRQSEIIAFLSSKFGRYPFATGGGIVDDVDIGFALETQTRPVYSWLFWVFPGQGDIVVVHELAHQWYGDSLTVAAWRHIWLNEGFATYAEWLWSEHEGLGTAQGIFDGIYNEIPAADPFWSVIIGNPGPDLLLDFAVYQRGAMTLHQLRLAVGDADFFEILRRWAQSREGDNVTTAQFIALAERVSGESLDELFDTWLFTPRKPRLSATATSRAETSRAAVTKSEVARLLAMRLALRK
jgi:Peptidase family M1 domain/Peptidase M1 N-terminal domain